jgi:hypothetical protein
MPTARAQRLVRPDTSFGPFRYIEAVAWLIVALACRVAGTNETPWWPLALCGDSIAVLMAYMAVTRRVFEIYGRPARFLHLTFDRELRLSLRVFGFIVIVIIAATVSMAILGHASIAPYCLLGLDGMAFNGPTVFGRIWGAVIAALVLLLILGADRNSGKIRVGATLRSAVSHGVRFGAAVAVLVVFYIALGFVQGMVRNDVWDFWPITVSSQYAKNLIYFTFTLGFAMTRLWATLLILSYGLKPSGARARVPFR